MNNEELKDQFKAAQAEGQELLKAITSLLEGGYYIFENIQKIHDNMVLPCLRTSSITCGFDHYVNQYDRASDQAWGAPVNEALDQGNLELFFCPDNVFDVRDTPILGDRSAVRGVTIHAEHARETRTDLESMFSGNFFNTRLGISTLNLLGSDKAAVIGRSVRRFNYSVIDIETLIKSQNKESSLICSVGEDVIDMYATHINVGVVNSGATETTPITGAPVINIDNSATGGEVRNSFFVFNRPFGTSDNPLIRVIHNTISKGTGNKYVIKQGENMRGGAVHVTNEERPVVKVNSFDTLNINDDLIRLTDCKGANIRLHNRQGILGAGKAHIKLVGDCDGFYIDAMGFGSGGRSVTVDLGGNNGTILNSQDMNILNPGLQVALLQQTSKA